MLALPTDAAGRSRLLPASVPFRHFGAAALFQLAGWLLIAFEPGGVASFAGGLGPPLAALHCFTLGTLTMTALGAGLQLLPVATVQPVRAVGLARGLWWWLCGALALFVAGVARFDTELAAAGAIGTGVGLLAHAVLLAVNLFAARRSRAMIAFARAGLVALLTVVASGPVLALQWRFGWVADPASVALAHLIVACYGFLGLLTIGYSYLLVPMFMVTRAPPERAQYAVFAAALVAVFGSGLVVTLGGARGLVVAFAALGLAAGLAYSVQMFRVAARRRSRDAPWSLALMRIAWIALPASVALGAALAAAGAGSGSGAGAGAAHALGASAVEAFAGALALEAGRTTFVALLVLGWLLSFMLAVALRIVPFLASVHAKLRHGRLPLVSAMTPSGAARLAALGHALAVVVLLGGLLFGGERLVRLAGLIGAAGAIAFAVFLSGVLRRARRPGGAGRGGGPGVRRASRSAGRSERPAVGARAPAPAPSGGAE